LIDEQPGGILWSDQAFHKKYIEAHLKMENSAILATRADDGVGKPVIANFLDDVTSKMAGHRMQKVEMDFQRNHCERRLDLGVGL
jgi:hypothetical protein